MRGTEDGSPPSKVANVVGCTHGTEFTAVSASVRNAEVDVHATGGAITTVRGTSGFSSAICASSASNRWRPTITSVVVR